MLRFPVDAGAVLVKRLDQPAALLRQQAGVELRHCTVDLVEADGGGVHDLRVTFPHAFQVDMLDRADGVLHRMVQADRRKAVAVQLVVIVLFKFQSFVHDFVIFSCLLFAFEAIAHPLARSPHHPAHGVTEAAGADVYPTAGGEGGGFYLHASVIPNGIDTQAPLPSLTSARMNCLLMAGW